MRRSRSRKPVLTARDKIVEDMKGFVNKRTGFRQEPVQRTTLDDIPADAGGRTFLHARIHNAGSTYTLVFGWEQYFKQADAAKSTDPVPVRTMAVAEKTRVRDVLHRSGVTDLVTFW